MPIPAALNVLATLRRDGLAVSIVTLGELFEGAYHSASPHDGVRAIRDFLSGYTVLNLSEEIIERFAQNRAQLRDEGKTIPDLDLLIAATALDHDLTLVTRNLRHFTRIPGLRIYGTT